MGKFELVSAPVVRSVEMVRTVGGTALELFDSERLVRRLSREQNNYNLRIAQESFDTALQSQDSELVRAQAVHMARVVARGLLHAVEREENAYGEQIDLLRTMLHDHLPNHDVATLGLDEREAAIFRGIIEQ